VVHRRRFVLRRPVVQRRRRLLCRRVGRGQLELELRHQLELGYGRRQLVRLGLDGQHVDDDGESIVTKKKPTAEPSPELEEAREIVANVTAAARLGESTDLEAQLHRLGEIATPALLPDLLGALEDDDPAGLLWSLFYVAEGMDDAYLVALLDALPGLHRRAPRWAETAVIRILNTRGEPDDCTVAFLELASQRGVTLRRLIVRIATDIAADPEELAPGQLDTLREAVIALGGDPKKLKG
jgi:hypothetical protein